MEFVNPFATSQWWVQKTTLPKQSIAPKTNLVSDYSDEEQLVVNDIKKKWGTDQDASEIISQYRAKKIPIQSVLQSKWLVKATTPAPAPSKPIFQDTRADEWIIEQWLKAIPRGVLDTAQFALWGAEQTSRWILNLAGRLGSTAGKAVRSWLENAGVNVPTVQWLKPWEPMKENVFSNTIGAAKEATLWDQSFSEAYKEANKADVERYGNQWVGWDLLDIGTGIRKAWVSVAAPLATAAFSTAANAPWVQYAPQALNAALMAPVNYADKKLWLGLNEWTKENIAFNLGMRLTKPFAKTELWNTTGLAKYHEANDAVMSPIVKPVQNIGKAVVEKGWQVIDQTKQAITPNWANISTRANRFNALDEQKFMDATWETPGQFATSRWMTKVWPKAVDEAVQNFEKSKAEADNAFWKIEWNFRYNGKWEDLVNTMISDLDKRLKNVKSPEAPKIEELKNKYENEWLSMSEINDLKRIYARNFKYSFQEMGSEPAMRSTNLQNALREWQFWVAKDNWLSNIAEINKNTQGWKMFADSLAKKLDRSWANNQFWLTDWIALAWWTPANIALFLGKQWLSSNFIKEKAIKTFSKQKKPAIIKASTEWIVKSNIEKKYANPNSVLPSGSSPGGESMVRPAWLLPAPSKKTLTRNQNVEVSKKLLKESKAKEAVTKQPEVTTRSKIVIPKKTKVSPNK